MKWILGIIKAVVFKRTSFTIPIYWTGYDRRKEHRENNNEVGIKTFSTADEEAKDTKKGNKGENK
jgi:hypothetical protein